MTKEVKEQILKWIFNNHQHHTEKACPDGGYPYVNSLELSTYIKSIKEVE